MQLLAADVLDHMVNEAFTHELIVRLLESKECVSQTVVDIDESLHNVAVLGQTLYERTTRRRISSFRLNGLSSLQGVMLKHRKRSIERQ